MHIEERDQTLTHTFCFLLGSTSLLIRGRQWNLTKSIWKMRLSCGTEVDPVTPPYGSSDKLMRHGLFEWLIKKIFPQKFLKMPNW